MILVVEDDPNVARLIALVLERQGHAVEIVSDGRRALERAAQGRPALIFGDLTIRGMGGETLCSAIKASNATRHIPFIVLSGDRDIAEKAASCGANGYLGKPFEFDDLVRLADTYAANEKRQTT